MIAYDNTVKTDVDPELKQQKGTAKFACLCGKRQSCYGDVPDKPD